MRLIPALLLLLVCSTLSAEEQKSLDPSKPEDAIQVINILTAEVQMSRRNAEAFRLALETLAKAVADRAKSVEVKPQEGK